MAPGIGESADAVAAARAVLARRDAALLEADHQLADAVSAAHRVAADSVRRIEAIRAEIDTAVAGQFADTAVGAHELARLLLAKQRQLGDIVAAAAAEARAKAAVLQHLQAHYDIG